MITNPYKVLGVPDGADEEECTKAYKRLAKKYHPDLNPGDKTAERKMAEINAAYDQIKSGAGGAGQGGYNTYGGYGYGRQSRASSGRAPDYLSAAAQFIRTGQYAQAINLLNNISDRDAGWYYLSALANMAAGNRAVAEDHIKTAYAKDPGNATYQQAYQNITNGIDPLNYNPFSSVFDFSYDDGEPRRTYTVRRGGGCIGRILKFIFILIIIRIIVSLIFSASGARQSYRRYSQPGSSYGYSQNYDRGGYGAFGESSGEESDL